MELKKILSGVELFDGLNERELNQIAALFEKQTLQRGELLAEQGTPGEALYLVSQGFVEVIVENEDRPDQVVINLGTGQIIGEMSLVDQGPRSATVRAISNPTVVHCIHRSDFEELCEENNHIGYIVMRNIAADLSFKLRHRHLAR